MGQYHMPCNLDKREFLNPHVLGDGLKLLEFACSAEGTMTGLALLLAVSNGRGGGDLQVANNERANLLESHIIGRWAGDRLAIIGDYHEPEDVLGFTDQKVANSGGFNPEAKTDDQRFNGPLIGDVPWNLEAAKEQDVDLGWTDISNLVVEAMHMDAYMHRSRTEITKSAEGHEYPARATLYGDLSHAAVLESDGTIRQAKQEELPGIQKQLQAPPERVA